MVASKYLLCYFCWFTGFRIRHSNNEKSTQNFVLLSFFFRFPSLVYCHYLWAWRKNILFFIQSEFYAQRHSSLNIISSFINETRFQPSGNNRSSIAVLYGPRLVMGKRSVTNAHGLKVGVCGCCIPFQGDAELQLFYTSAFSHLKASTQKERFTRLEEEELQSLWPIKMTLCQLLKLFIVESDMTGRQWIMGGWVYGRNCYMTLPIICMKREEVH